MAIRVTNNTPEPTLEFVVEIDTPEFAIIRREISNDEHLYGNIQSDNSLFHALSLVKKIIES
jgi:hypothetical protein